MAFFYIGLNAFSVKKVPLFRRAPFEGAGV
jgi:hypothetical protein